MPNKLFEYAMAGLPVLVSDMKEMADFVRTHHLGGVISEFNPHSINQAIDELLTQNFGLVGGNAYRAASAHAWEVQEQTMLAAYAELLLNQDPQTTS